MVIARGVLIVDDDMDWFEVFRMAFQRAGAPHAVFGAKDGPEAIRYLSGEGAYADRKLHPLPELVLLDLRLPGMHGFEVLQWIRQQPSLAKLPVVVMTGMEIPGDTVRAKALGGNALVAKPFSFPKAVAVARRLRAEWLSEG